MQIVHSNQSFVPQGRVLVYAYENDILFTSERTNAWVLVWHKVQAYWFWYMQQARE